VLSGNPLTFTLLRAASTAYTTRGSGATGAPFALGKAIALVSALQTRANARLVVAGSVSLFTDTLVNGKSTAKFTGNRAFARGVLNWAFQRTGVLRIAHTDHHRVNQTRSEYYRIKDDMVYEVRIEELKDDKWGPFRADDVQMEATMLDPYLRVPFRHDNKGNFTARFTLPDQHGMYTLHLAYSRKGYAHLEAADIISVRPFRHNEYERFIPAAYPYYMTSFSMMAAVVVFSFVFLYHRDRAPARTPVATSTGPLKKTQ
jgi:oligosaccharyltransferase complex subunit beta